MENVIVLNSDFSFMGNIDWKRSIVLLYQGKAETIKESDKTIRNYDSSVTFIVPKIIRLVKYVTQVFKNKIPYSKSNIFIRDDFVCQYCNKKLEKSECTVDHIIPKAKKGKSSWFNCVTSCKICNNKKGDTDLKKTGLFLKKKPIQPSVSDFTRIKSKLLINKLSDLW